MMRATCAVVFSSASLMLATPVFGYEKFVSRIPNGDQVSGVAALGHMDPAGGGPRNDFGSDFDDMGKTWNEELCQADSDGDGQTNGQELGDPCCKWSPESGSAPLWTTGVSHPGDPTQTSDSSLWASVKCSTTTAATSTSSSVESSTSADESASDSGSDFESVKASASSSNSTEDSSSEENAQSGSADNTVDGSSATPTPTTTTSGVSAGATISATAGVVALLVALVA